MRETYFLSEEHYNYFKKFMDKNNTPADDLYRASLFYILSSLDKFRRNINKIYNFKVNGINPKVADEIYLSHSERGLLELAFHLYNSSNEFNLDDTFKYFGDERLLIALNGIQIRYNGDIVYYQK